jgi:hypothetical protein
MKRIVECGGNTYLPILQRNMLKEENIFYQLQKR